MEGAWICSSKGGKDTPIISGAEYHGGDEAGYCLKGVLFFLSWHMQREKANGTAVRQKEHRESWYNVTKLE